MVIASWALLPACLAPGGADEVAAGAIVSGPNGVWRVADEYASRAPFRQIVLSNCEFEARGPGQAPIWGTFAVEGGPKTGTLHLDVLRQAGQTSIPWLWRYWLEGCADKYCTLLYLGPAEDPKSGAWFRFRDGANLTTFRDSPSYARAGPMSCAEGLEAQALTEKRADCDRDPANGAETDLLSDPQSCGACGYRCDSPGHPTVAGWTCDHGLCQVASCVAEVAPAPRAHYRDCDGRGATGCERVEWGTGCPADADIRIVGDGRTQNRYQDGWGEAWIVVDVDEEQFWPLESDPITVAVSLSSADKAAYALEVYEGRCGALGDPLVPSAPGQPFVWADGWGGNGPNLVVHVRDTGGGVSCEKWLLSVTGGQ